MKHEDLSRAVAAEGIVLLKNEDRVLPLSKEMVLPVFGEGQNAYYKCGDGSGNVYSSYAVTIPEGLKNAGYRLNSQIESAYQHGRSITAKQIAVATQKSDTALVVLSRNSTEFWDRRVKDDFDLTDTEQRLLEQLENSNFVHIVVVLNIAEPINMSFIQQYKKIKALILAWLPGMEGGNAVADIISGKVNPSGRLTDTLAYSYADYPGSANHHFFADTVYYEEDLYVGYRYFETVQGAAKRVAYPFGYGLSYTAFELRDLRFSEENDRVCVMLTVRNNGACAGKEVVQLYAQLPDGGINRPRYELKAFRKTGLLQPGKSQTVNFMLPKADFKAFDEQQGAWVLQKGVYTLYVGKNIRDLSMAGSFTQAQQQVLMRTGLKLTCALPTQLQSDGSINTTGYYDQRTCRRRAGVCAPISENELQKPGGNHTLYDVRDGKISLSAFIKELSVYEMINLCQAQPPAIPRGTAGIGNLFTRRIPNIQTADGPAGLRVSTPTTCFPCATLAACTWNPVLQYKMGRAMGEECRTHNIDILLAPALNIHRDPLCGRNFEYFSEDPLVSGKAAAAIVKGIQSCGVAATIKHFICNNQERFRIFSNSVVSERALREIYLKGFEIAVKEAKPYCLMTSYNMINHIRSSSNYGLLSGILRQEWGYKGAIMTDWRTDSHLFEEIKAGNNVKMPYGYPDEIQQAMMYASLNNLDIRELRESVRYILKLILKSIRFKNADFGPIHSVAPAGETIIPAVELRCVSHTYAGIEDCLDEGGGQNLRRLEKDMRGNDCFVSYCLSVEETGTYALTARFAAEDSTSFMEVCVDGNSIGILPGLSQGQESKEWDEDNKNAPHLPKLWVTSQELEMNLFTGMHELCIYIRTKEPRRTMSIHYLKCRRVKE